MLARIALALAVLTLASACSSSRGGKVPRGAVPPDELTAGVSTNEPTLEPEWQPDANTPRIRPGYSINVSISVAGRREIEEQRRRIGNDGMLSLPLIGMVKAEGLTPEELGRNLRKQYEAYYVDPLVTVEYAYDEIMMSASPWGYVNVLGKVGAPGRISIPPSRDLTVSRAIQLAGGLGPTAKDTAIKVSRRKADGTKETFEVNLERLGTGDDRAVDIVLAPGDVVYVPEVMF
jgi:polysaccharide export outer membrane protein